jgi:hypothetical protein
MPPLSTFQLSRFWVLGHVAVPNFVPTLVQNIQQLVAGTCDAPTRPGSQHSMRKMAEEHRRENGTTPNRMSVRIIPIPGGPNG